MDENTDDRMDISSFSMSVLNNESSFPKGDAAKEKEPVSSTSSQVYSDFKLEQASTGSDSGGKKSRPKRGKYRNYDRDALVKAVRAVQNGEMSVHRAG